MSEPSLSPSADRARRRSTPVGTRRGARGTLLCLLLTTLLAGCTAASAGESSPAPVGVATTSPTTVETSASATPRPTGTSVAIDADAVAKRIAGVSRQGIGASGVAVVTETGATIAGRGSAKALAPASTMKILTTLAALDTLGAEHTFSTTVVREPGGRVVLVGGGDPLLTDKASTSVAKPASLEALAKATASALKASGVKKVSLGYDDSLFSGPDFNPAWTKKWHTFLARVSPLTVGEGLYNPWQADQKPARTAANAFAQRLEARGITVTKVTSAIASDDATELASVESAPLSSIVARTLRLSDNHAAEVLARHVAIAAGEEPSFAGETRAVKAWLVAHDLWDDGMRLVDGSGLSSRSRVTPSVLARAVALSLDTESLSSVAASLPVAGKSGTLKDRFNDASERIGRGNVHAKTGTLPGIGALAGYLTTQDGTRLVFAVMANDGVGQTTTQNFLDRTAAALVRCGCGG